LVLLPPPQASEHVDPAAQVSVRPPLHCAAHAPGPPHTIVQAELPVQSAVHAPFGQRTVHALLPPQETVDPVSTVTSQVLPPAHLTWLSVPVDTVQWLVPAHDHVQFEVQLPLHVDCPSQFVVQPVPHEAVQVFFDVQW
jgi:hypothetical protein